VISWNWQYIFPLAAFAALFYFSVKLPRTTASATFMLVTLVALFGIHPHIAGLFGTTGMPVSAVHIPYVAAIGNGEETLLTADNPDMLDAWLRKGGFRTLSADDRRIAEGLISDKWCFVAGRGRKTTPRLSAPYPLEISFKTGAPVMPVGIIGSAGHPIYTDLIVISDSAYGCPKLRTEFSGRFKDWSIGTARQICSDETQVKSALQEAQFYFDFGNRGCGQVTRHSESLTLLWDGCVVSKLSGPMGPNDVTGDIRLTSASPGKCTILTTNKAALQAGVIGASLLLFAATVLASIPLCFVRRARRWRFVRTGRMYLWILGLSVVFGLLVWAATPTARAQDVPQPAKPTEPNRNTHDLYESAFISACEVPGGPAEKLLAMYDPESKKWPTMNDEMRGLLRQLADSIEPVLLKAGEMNEITGEPYAFEESPGDVFLFLVDGDSGQICFSEYYFDPHG